MKTKCAKWCGHGCTKAEYNAARKLAADIVRRLKGKWVPEVWENLGWHAGAKTPCGRLKVYPSGSGFTAYLSYARSSAGNWTAQGKTPQAAVDAVITKAKRLFEPVIKLANELESLCK